MNQFRLATLLARMARFGIGGVLDAMVLSPSRVKSCMVSLWTTDLGYDEEAGGSDDGE